MHTRFPRCVNEICPVGKLQFAEIYYDSFGRIARYYGMQRDLIVTLFATFDDN